MPEELEHSIGKISLEINHKLSGMLRSASIGKGGHGMVQKKMLSDLGRVLIKKRQNYLSGYLCWLGYRAVGGGFEDEAMVLSAVAELYSFYISNLFEAHNDVISPSLLHGRYNSTVKYLQKNNRSKPIGGSINKIAYTCGDLILNLAIENIIDLPVDNSVKQQLLKRLAMWSQANITYFSQSLVAGKDEASLKKIIKYYSHDYARANIVQSLLFGSILANGNERLTSKLEQYGQNMVLAYRIAEDLSDMYTPTDRSTLEFIRNGRPSLVIYYSLMFATDTDKKLILSCYGNSLASANTVKQMRRILNQSGAKAKAIFQANKYANDAKKAIASIEFSGNVNHQLNALADRIGNIDSQYIN